jgi:hypothetical protein
MQKTKEEVGRDLFNGVAGEYIRARRRGLTHIQAREYILASIKHERLYWKETSLPEDRKKRLAYA